MTLTGVRVAETDFVAFAEGAQSLDGLGMSGLLFQVSEVVEGVDQRGVEGVVLLRGGASEQERIEIERDVFI